MLARFAAGTAGRSNARLLGSFQHFAAVAAFAAAVALCLLSPLSAPAVVQPSTSGSSVGTLGGEVVGERTRTSRTYLRVGGTATDRITRVYAGSVNYRARSGDWLPIDNALVSTTGGYRNKASWFDVELPDRLAGQEVAVAEGGDRVAFSLRGADARGSVDGSAIEYRAAFPDVDVRYEVKADWLKELVVLKSPSARRSFVFDLKLSKGLVPELSGGAVVLRDRGGAVRMALGAPFMIDADGSESRAVRFALAKAGGEWELTMTADNAWLDAAGRAYPVTIDPQVFPGAQADCTINQSSPWSDACSASTLSVGGTSLSQRRSVLRFDIAGAVPFGSTVTNAALGMKLQSQTVSEAMTVKLHRLNTAFYSSASWNAPWATPGGDFPTTADCASCPLVGGASTGAGTQPGSHAYWSITALVGAWATGALPNHGMLLKADPLTGSGNVATFGSNESSFGSQPFIDTTYQPPARTGEYPQATLESQVLTDRSGFGVNVANGNLLLANSDLEIAGTGLDLVIDRHYNGLSQLTGSLGRGWSLSTGQDVRLSDAGSKTTVQATSGELLVFDRNVGGSYTSPPGLHASLKRVVPEQEPCSPDGYCPEYLPPFFELTDHASGGVMVFTSSQSGGQERLLEQRDRYGNRIKFSYSGGKLTSIFDTQGRTVTVTQANGRITRLNDLTGRYMQYGYDTQGRLETYTDGAGKLTRYAYDTANRVKSITTPVGNVTLIMYESTTGRVKTIVRTTDAAHTTGPKTTFDYYAAGTAPCAAGQTKTVVSDPLAATSPGHTVTYCGDTLGRVVKRVDASGNTTSTSYGATGDPASVTRPRGGITNYAYDPQTRNLLCLQKGASAVANCATATGGLKTTYEYANSDSLTKLFPTKVTNPQGKSVFYCYNGSIPTCGDGLPESGPSGSLRSTSNELTVQKLRRWVYNSHGNVTSEFDARGYETRYGYDADGNLRSITPPAGASLGAWTITPDALSRPRTIVDGKNVTQTTTFDNLDRATDVSYSAGPAVSYGFDEDGVLRTLTDPSGSVTNTPDPLGRLKTQTFPGGTLAYTYDDANNLKTITDQSGQTRYDYNGLNQLTALWEPGDAVATTFAYNADGGREQIRYPSGVTVNWDYLIPSGRVRSVANKSATGAILKSYDYSYVREDGKDTELPETVTSNLGPAEAVSSTDNDYDAIDRLIYSETSGGREAYFRYTFDGNGNRLNSTKQIGHVHHDETDLPLVSSYAYDSANLPCWRASEDVTSADCGITVGVERYTHDANGDDLNNNQTGFTYNNARQAATATIPPGALSVQRPVAFRGLGTAEMTLDGPHTLQHSLPGLTRIWSSSLGARYYARADDGTLISQRTATGRHNYLYDGEDSVVALVDATTGAVTNSYRYEPYGHPLENAAQGDINPFGYLGAYIGVSEGSPPRQSEPMRCCHEGSNPSGPSSIPIYRPTARNVDTVDGRATQASPKAHAQAAEDVGDLTAAERKKIQDVVDRAGRPIEVVGSAARGERGPGSDIDYTAPNSSHPYLQPHAGDLPGLDPAHGILHGGAQPLQGPSIRFEPRR